MRALIFIFLIFILVLGGVGAFAAMREDGPSPFAIACSASSEKITNSENCAGPPDGNLVELLKGNKEDWLLLDMGEGQEGTGGLMLYYQTNNNVNVVIEFNGVENDNITPIESVSVTLAKGSTSIMAHYENAPTPYRYVRIYAPEERKFQLDAVRAETHRPDSDGDGLPDQWELEYGLNPLVNNGRDGPNEDLDGDFLTNKAEQNHHTNPTKADTDDDGLPDKWEIDHGLKPDNNEGRHGTHGDLDEDGLTNIQEYSYNSHPDRKDTDKDGLEDLQEIQGGTDPSIEDTDGDELPDGWENTYGLNPLSSEGENGKNGDPDQDQLLNLDEFKAKANPNKLDTDEDGTGDKVEVDGDKDPANWDDGDLDGDGLSNGDEKNKYGSNEWNQDTDGDGLTDFWEAQYGFNLTIATGNDGAEGDPDNDGVNNLTEQHKGSSPHEVDTDEDGLPDAWEIRHCLNPNSEEGDHGPDGDPDGDGKTNFSEMGMGSPATLDCSP